MTNETPNEKLDQTESPSLEPKKTVKRKVDNKKITNKYGPKDKVRPTFGNVKTKFH
jgi:hypothetical protein